MVNKAVETFRQKTLQAAVTAGASDLHLSPGSPPALRIDGRLHYLEQPLITADLMADVFRTIAGEQELSEFTEYNETDFAYMEEARRFRINAFRHQRGISLAIRILAAEIPQLEDLGQPPGLMRLLQRRHGLLLVTGATGSGKSTTLAAIIDGFNRTQALHIVTLEDPIEYLHPHRHSIIEQREAGRDFKSFPAALRSALREDPDVIMVGELRDAPTIQTALTAAETGHLVLATLHTADTSEAVLRLTGMFPSHQQEQIRLQLSLVLIGITSQQLLPKKVGPGRVCAVEVLQAVPAIRNLIREGRPQHIFSQLQMGRATGMQTMDMAIRELLAAGQITRSVAKLYSKTEITC
ncbi:MAG: type IV pilus twitching motility protein PilT [Selenomonadaceae bacterium]|jgi:pilus retraction protein PilT